MTVPTHTIPADWPPGDPVSLKRLAVDGVVAAIRFYRLARDWHDEMRAREKVCRPIKVWPGREGRTDKEWRNGIRWEHWGNIATVMVGAAERALLESIASIPPDVDWTTEPGGDKRPWEPRAVIFEGHVYTLVLDDNGEPLLAVTPARKVTTIEGAGA